MPYELMRKSKKIEAKRGKMMIHLMKKITPGLGGEISKKHRTRRFGAAQPAKVGVQGKGRVGVKPLTRIGIQNDRKDSEWKIKRKVL